MKDKVKKKLYFINTGVKFDIYNKDKIFNVWNCNGNCCKSDLSNGLDCEEWGIYFNKVNAEEIIRCYVENGIEQSYGYINEIDIEIDSTTWKEIKEYLIKEYELEADKINEFGFIPWVFVELLNDICPYWKEPDVSYYKNNNKQIEKNTLHIYTEDNIDKNIMKYINDELYGNKINQERENYNE